VPQVTFLFWVIKILTTCGGEAVPDYLALGNRQVGAAVTRPRAAPEMASGGSALDGY
jgi:uncharacterized membrane-anchored protein